MAQTLESTRDRILRSAYTLFQQRGYARVSIDVIAQTAGLTKRTLYYHFRSKDDLLSDVVDMQSGLAIARIREWLVPMPDDPDVLIDELFKRVVTAASTPKWAGEGFTRIALELADLPGHPARVIARRHKVAMEAWLSDELASRRVKDPIGTAREIMLLLEGCLSLILIHGDRDYADRAARAAKALAMRNVPFACAVAEK